MFKISKESIKPLAVDEATYYRGLRYYKNNAVTNVTWSKTNKQYRANVKGGNKYMVTIDLTEKEELHYSCNCPGHIKYKGACKHVIATLLFIEHYMERAKGKQPETPEEKSIMQILNYFSKMEEAKVYGETFELEPIITIPSLLKNDVSKVFIGLQAGNSRFYKIQNMKKFLTDISQKQNITLGKEFQFFYGESRFSKESQRILDYFLEIFEIQESLGKVYYSNLFTKAEMTLSKNMFLKLLSLIGERPIKLNLYDRLYEDVKVALIDPPIALDLDLNGASIQLDFKEDTQVIPIVEDGSILFYKNAIYLPSKEFITNYLPFYTILGKDKNPLIFTGEHKNKFLEVVLPKIYETMTIEIPDTLKDYFIQGTPIIKIYLDKYKSYIKLRVLFQYGEYEINPQTGEISSNIIILRDRKKEHTFLEELEKMYFIPYKDGFLLKQEDKIYEFLLEKVHELSKQYLVFYAEDFKNLSIKQPGNMHSVARVGKDSHLLELAISYDNVPLEELRELYHSLQMKKKYHRLKNGSFIDLQGKAMLDTKHLFYQLNLNGKDFNQEHILVPTYHALYMDSLLEQMNDIDYKKEETYQHLIDGIRTPKNQTYQVPETVHAKLRSYQVTGYRWLRTLADNLLGGILADDMGLGKTLQAITYMVSIKQMNHPKCPIFLVVCPTSLVYNWQDEFQKFAPHMETCIIKGSPEEREEQISNLNEVDVCITSYPLLRRDIEWYDSIEFHTLFIDEAQFIKNANSLNAKSVKKINALHRFALTGTPIENSLWELWSIFDFILPSYLMSHSKFAERYEKPIMKNQDEDALEDLGKHIRPFILRRMKRDVLKELPEKIETKMVCELTEQQRKIYLSYLENIRGNLFQTDTETEKKSMEILAALTRLRQICCHPSTFIEQYKGGSGKLELLLELLENTLENGHRVLIFSQFTSMLQLIEAELKKEEIDYFYLEGSTKTEVRKEYITKFNQGERSVFLISLKAGGTGLNLTGADTVIHYDPWWNPAVEDQATDRAYRIGQNKSVQVIKLIAKDTIEEKIYKLQQKKKEITNTVIKNREVFINHLTKEELEEIFQL